MAMPKGFGSLGIQTQWASNSFDVVGAMCVCASIEASHVTIVAKRSEVNDILRCIALKVVHYVDSYLHDLNLYTIR